MISWTVVKMIITEVHSIPSYTYTYTSRNWKQADTDYLKR